MIEIARGSWVERITLKELSDKVNEVHPMLIVGRPPTHLNDTMYDWCEWLRFNPSIAKAEVEKSCQYKQESPTSWFMLWNAYKDQEVFFYDYQNKIVYVDEWSY